MFCLLLGFVVDSSHSLDCLIFKSFLSLYLLFFCFCKCYIECHCFEFSLFLVFFLTACYEVYNSTNGSFKSPNYPSYYPHGVNCRYIIKNMDPSNRIILTFLRFGLESHSACNYDSVKIYAGNSTDAPYLGSHNGYCGYSRPPILKAPIGKDVLIVFKTDVSVTGSGFVISYRGKFDVCSRLMFLKILRIVWS